ncbi:four helix bundle protein [Emticicia sp. C21]|uniref:four helix bundle protein n=1 Tax=Emticicia sp. C21 TaxID=2302915 RepID=UPI000E354A6B|nr:four helix bundle protein [Emticicia sp. C21]RFS18556.1 four helix bundle protein [Emticicia sp. C21]
MSFFLEDAMVAYMPKEEFAELMMKRIKTFAIRCIKVSESLPNSIEANVFKTQLVRSSSSTAANYRAVRRARSRNEFFSKISIVIEELDESIFWLEMIIDLGYQTQERLNDLIKEGYELLSILSKARKNTKQ